MKKKPSHSAIAKEWRVFIRGARASWNEEAMKELKKARNPMEVRQVMLRAIHINSRAVVAQVRAAFFQLAREGKLFV